MSEFILLGFHLPQGDPGIPPLCHVLLRLPADPPWEHSHHLCCVVKPRAPYTPYASSWPTSPSWRCARQFRCAKMLADIISQTKSISYAGCLLQFYFFFSMCAAEGYFLSAMSFDRFLAICRPLHYPTIMTYQLCFPISGFLLGRWLLSILMPASSYVSGAFLWP